MISIAIYYNNIFSNLALNLGTELIGIIFVVLYVDWIIKKSEKEKWLESDKIIKSKIEKIISVYGGALRQGLGYESPFSVDALNDINTNNVHKEIMEGLCEILPKFKEDYDNLSKEKIEKIVKILPYINSQIDHLWSIFIPIGT